MKRIYKHIFLLSIITLVIITGCSKKSERSQNQKLSVTEKQEKKNLVLYNWEEYIGSDTLENFEKESGIHVTLINFKDEEEMLGAVQSDLSAFDLVVVSDDTAREMIEAKIIAKLDYSKIPNFKNISEKYLHQPYDPKQQFTLPYLLGTTGMVINNKFIKKDKDSWGVLWNKKYKKKLAMLNNPFEVAGAACKLLGYSINTVNMNELKEAKKLLLEQKPLLHGYYDVIKIQEMLQNETLWAAHTYSGEGLAATDENENLEYIIPKEGAVRWIDLFIIPRDAKHKEEAHTFLNYILRPDVNSSIASELWYATSNKAAKYLMDKEVLESPSVYPSSEILSLCEFFMRTGDESTREVQAIWTNLNKKN